MSGLYECGSCGHTWKPDDVFADLDAVKCEVCEAFDTIIRQVREGFERGVVQGQVRLERRRLEAAHRFWDAYRIGLVQLSRPDARKAEKAKSEKGGDDG
jgi:hypothetical protein